MPAFECYQLDQEERSDATVIEAAGVEEAAIAYAETWDDHCGEGYADEQSIAVKPFAGDEWDWVVVRVFAEPTIHRHAELVTS
jgi:hypothetical protein